jgi:hypothetical protein
MNISLCPWCHCMTHTLIDTNGKYCGKCGGIKNE